MPFEATIPRKKFSIKRIPPPPLPPGFDDVERTLSRTPRLSLRQGIQIPRTPIPAEIQITGTFCTPAPPPTPIYAKTKSNVLDSVTLVMLLLSLAAHRSRPEPASTSISVTPFPSDCISPVSTAAAFGSPISPSSYNRQPRTPCAPLYRPSPVRAWSPGCGSEEEEPLNPEYPTVRLVTPQASSTPLALRRSHSLDDLSLYTSFDNTDYDTQSDDETCYTANATRASSRMEVSSPYPLTGVSVGSDWGKPYDLYVSECDSPRESSHRASIYSVHFFDFDVSGVEHAEQIGPEEAGEGSDEDEIILYPRSGVRASRGAY